MFDESERGRLTEAAEQAGIASIEVVERSAWETIRRLAGAGIVRLTEAGDVLHRSSALDEAEPEDRAGRIRNRQVALDWLNQAKRKLRMANLLADGDFAEEALPPLCEVASLAIRGIAIAVDPGLEPAMAETIPEAELTELAAIRAQLPPGSIAHLALIGGAVNGTANIAASRVAAQSLLAAARAAAARNWAA